MRRHQQVAGFILGGGASSRMGRDKALLDFGGAPLILHTARLLEPLVTEVTIVGSPERYASLGLPAIADENGAQTRRGRRKLGRGPLAGIAAALQSTRSPWNVILACDLPYLSTEWLDWLLARALRSRSQAVVPRTGRGIEPLAAVYRRECAAPIAAALARGVRKVSDALKECRVEFVDSREWQKVDPNGLVLKNMNEPHDYQDGLKWWSARDQSANQPVTKSRLRKSTRRRSVLRPRK